MRLDTIVFLAGLGVAGGMVLGCGGVTRHPVEADGEDVGAEGDVPALPEVHEAGPEEAGDVGDELAEAEGVTEANSDVVEDSADTTLAEAVEPVIVELNISDTGGFDDFSSPGAALGFAVDEEQGHILVAALKFDLPLATKTFVVPGDVEATLEGYDAGTVPESLDGAVAQYPPLASAVTDTAGIRSMSGEVTLLLLQGDVAAGELASAYVADSGEVTLHRLDGPKDTLEGSASFVQVTGFGKGGKPVPGGQRVNIAPFYFEWATGEQE